MSPITREVVAMLLAFVGTAAVVLVVGFIQTWRKGR